VPQSLWLLGVFGSNYKPIIGGKQQKPCQTVCVSLDSENHDVLSNREIGYARNVSPSHVLDTLAHSRVSSGGAPAQRPAQRLPCYPVLPASSTVPPSRRPARRPLPLPAPPVSGTQSSGGPSTQSFGGACSSCLQPASVFLVSGTFIT
jgi:hypothetical protein